MNIEKLKKIRDLRKLGLSHKFILLEGYQGVKRKYGIALNFNSKNIFFTEYTQGSAIKENPSLIDVVYCLFSDSSAYESSNFKLNNFYKDLGYEDIDQAIKAFDACKNTFEALQVIPEETREKIQEIIQDY